jgi:hypothetical protein
MVFKGRLSRGCENCRFVSTEIFHVLLTYECSLTRLCRTVHTKVSVVPVLLPNNLLINISVMKNAQNVRAV